MPTPTPIIIVATPTPLPAEVMAAADVEEQLIINVYQRVSPAVVHITSRAIALDFFWGPIPQEGTGSGFIIDKEGHIVTNYHVVEGAESIEVTLADGTTAPAELVGADPYNDLAVIKIEVPPHKLHPVELGSSSDLRVGQRAIAIGNPFGLDRTLTVGVISSLGRIIEREGERALGELIQTDAAINPGNSGGPLLDSQGRVIGVNTAIKSPIGASVGIGFAVPVDTVNRVVPQLIRYGRVERPGLGIYPASRDIVEQLGIRGVLVLDVLEGGAAEEAGLRPTRRGPDGRLRLGDIIVAIDGKPIENLEDVFAVLDEHVVGDRITVSVLREKEGRDQDLRRGGKGAAETESADELFDRLDLTLTLQALPTVSP